MKKLFIIGTGRNGSKLTGRVLGTAVNKKNRFGEIHHGLDPVFFKDVYHEAISATTAVELFKKSRDKAMKSLDGIYVEKNHLIVPILHQVIKAYPDALFLYVYRYPKDIIRSLYSRDVYTGQSGKYEDGRLTPNKYDPYYTKWDSSGKFEKVCWYVYTMMSMCKEFLSNLPENSYRTISYNDFVIDHLIFKDVFDWLGINFNIEKIDNVFKNQVGSSARSNSELNFKINSNKVKNTKHWRDWSKSKNKIYGEFFDE
jgi:hypothetical protein